MSINSTYEIENREDYALIRFSGFVDASTVVQARPVLQQQVPPTAKNFIVDLSGADFLDSHGVGLFVNLLKRVHRTGGRFYLAAADGQPLAVLRMVGFNNTYVTYCNDVRTALYMAEQDAQRNIRTDI